MKINMSKVLSFACLLVCTASGMQAQNWKYPKVENNNTIVSRDAAGGIKSEALLTAAEKTFLMNKSSQPIYDDASKYNKVSEKFQVASTDASTSSTWADAYTKCKSYSTDGNQGSWRVPTQRELILIWMLKAKLTGFGNIAASITFWSGTELSQETSMAHMIYPSSNLIGPFDKGTTMNVRCVRDL